MSESRLGYLFQVYFNKSATPDEREELMELVSRAENDEATRALLDEAWQGYHSRTAVFNEMKREEMVAYILNKAASTQVTPVIGQDRRSVNWLQTAAAAAILLFVVSGVFYWLYQNKPGQPFEQSKDIAEKAVRNIHPGTNKAVLTLSDGSSIVLDSAHLGTVAGQGNANITQINTATLSYRANGGKGKGEGVVYNTLSAPRGGQYRLILCDGTQVWLNASSSIHFPTTFNDKERKVSISGEAYFEVAKNADMPFVVSTKDIEVHVLGTHFNIKAYDDEKYIITTLLEGSVKISKGSLSKMLVPGQQSRIGNAGGISIVEADRDEVMAWKNGWFQFNACGIEEVMRQISRWYDVDVVYEGKIPTGHFSGLVSRKNDIAQVLEIIQTGNARFRMEGKKVVVLSN